jgi:CheY-like chemotaxis protein
MEKRIKVLIANDSAEFRSDTGRVFENSGLEVTYAPKDGMKLLDKIEASCPNVVLSNLFMPRLDGIGVHCCQLKLNDRFLCDGETFFSWNTAYW